MLWKFVFPLPLPPPPKKWPTWSSQIISLAADPRGGTSIETLYGDVPPKWVGFWQKIPKHGSHFFTPKSLNMGPFFVKITKIFWARNASPENFQKIPKHGSIFWAKSLNMGTFFTSKHGLGSRGPGGSPPSKPKSSTPPPGCGPFFGVFFFWSFHLMTSLLGENLSQEKTLTFELLS